MKDCTTSFSSSSRFSKAVFLQNYSPKGEYGYGTCEEAKERVNREGYEEELQIDYLRIKDFPSLYDPQKNPGGVIYLDHAGATLYAQSQLRSCFENLQGGIFGNPHSKGPVSSITSDEIEKVRTMVLAHFHVASSDEWSVVFTSGATAALKLAAEIFPWSEMKSKLIYAHNSHTSVLGMREIALARGATFTCLPASCIYVEHNFQVAMSDIFNESGETDCQHLLVLPAECNFTGKKMDTSLLGSCSLFQDKKVTVVLDGAKLVGTADLDLSSERMKRVDMVCLSFYKMFGFPTGLGALLIRNAASWAADGARRGYFGGGTVQAVLPQTAWHVPRKEFSLQLADGTENFLGIVQLGEGFRLLRELQMARIQAHTWTLIRFLYDHLLHLKHGNDQVAVKLYSPYPMDSNTQGPTVAFNLLRRNGEMIGYTEVDKLTSLHGIQLRTGCFCNPGACQEALHLTQEDVLQQLEAGHVCWDDNDIIEGRPTGAVRVSLGYMSTWEDVAWLLHVLDKYFVSKLPAGGEDEATSIASLSSKLLSQTLNHAVEKELRLAQILIYPIKSCASMSITAWPLGPTGLLFDREWAVVDATGQALRLNRLPKMRFIKPMVDLQQQELRISAPGMPDLTISLSHLAREEDARSVSVCGEVCQGLGYQKDVDEWFSTFLEKPNIHLVRSSPFLGGRRQMHERGKSKSRKVEEPQGEEEEGSKGKEKKINFSNEAQFLLVCSASIDHLNDLIAQQMDLEYEFVYEGVRSDSTYVSVENFRPNLVIEGGVAHQEDLWDSLEIAGGVVLKVTGACARCSMVNIDHRRGSREKGGDDVAAAAAVPVLKTLASYRREKANILFGQFLALEEMSEDGWLRSRVPVRAHTRGTSPL